MMRLSERACQIIQARTTDRLRAEITATADALRSIAEDAPAPATSADVAELCARRAQAREARRVA